jgi:hypothetical protein
MYNLACGGPYLSSNVSETTKSMPRDVEREEKTASQIAK